MILVTGGAGFIGANFILNWFKKNSEAVLNIDKLTYAGNIENLKSLKGNANYVFQQSDIGDAEVLNSLLKEHKPRAIINFAAETHVDRSIDGPQAFINTNIMGTFNLLEISRRYFDGLSQTGRQQFKFLHVSTDEVFGSLNAEDAAFTEEHQFAPNSPYSASKASSDHLVRAYFKTYDLPAMVTHCSNNFGPYQYPEKLIPLIIMNCLSLSSLPIFGDGLNVRDWLFVDDHCSALMKILEQGKIGESYNIGGGTEINNLEMVDHLCRILDQKKPRTDGKSYLELKTFIPDRRGHDRRYAVNISKIKNSLGWSPDNNFSRNLEKTVDWYLDHQDWIKAIEDKRKT